MKTSWCSSHPVDQSNQITFRSTSLTRKAFRFWSPQKKPGNESHFHQHLPMKANGIANWHPLRKHFGTLSEGPRYFLKKTNIHMLYSSTFPPNNLVIQKRWVGKLVSPHLVLPSQDSTSHPTLHWGWSSHPWLPSYSWIFFLGSMFVEKSSTNFPNMVG